MNISELNILPGIQNFVPEMKRWIHDFHKYPELPKNVQRTSSRIAELLRSFKLDIVEENLLCKSVIGVIKNGDGPVVALASPIEGQNIQ